MLRMLRRSSMILIMINLPTSQTLCRQETHILCILPTSNTLYCTQHSFSYFQLMCFQTNSCQSFNQFTLLTVTPSVGCHTLCFKFLTFIWAKPGPSGSMTLVRDTWLSTDNILLLQAMYYAFGTGELVRGLLPNPDSLLSLPLLCSDRALWAISMLHPSLNFTILS